MKTIQIKERPKLKTSELLQLCRDKFPVWSYLSDEELDKQFPAPEKATSRIFLDSIEPDKETLGKSVQEADPNQKGITFRERIIMELEYFKKTGNHLDIKGATFCSGSSNADGYVPGCYWYGGKFRVDWYYLGHSYSDYGVRSAVALDSFSFNPEPDIEKAIEIVKQAGYKIIKEI